MHQLLFSCIVNLDLSQVKLSLTHVKGDGGTMVLHAEPKARTSRHYACFFRAQSSLRAKID